MGLRVGRRICGMKRTCITDMNEPTSLPCTPTARCSPRFITSPPPSMRWRALASLALGCVALTAHAQSEPPAPPPELPFNLTAYLPHDVFNPIPGATGTQAPMDSFSWQTFVALNWPASEKENGVPDTSLKIGGQPPMKGSYYPKGMRSSPVVWETFKDANDIFTPDGSVPTPFSAKARHVLFDTTESFTDSPLNDQNGRHVYYEVRLNEVEYDYIVGRKLYLKANQTPPIVFPAGDNATKQVGSIHIKAAWKIMGKGDNPDHFYTTEALIYNPGRSGAYLAKVGLVGLHIAHKTVGRPEWIWSTFEQTENAADLPAAGGSITPGTYNFTNASCPVDKCPPNQQVSADSTQPVQALRVTPINASTKQLNQEWQAALHAWNPKTVWQYYELVSTQWPADPGNTKIFGGAQPAFLANITMETYFQGPSPAQPTASNPPHSCIDCHGMFAQKKDFMFQLDKAFPRKSTVPGIFNPEQPDVSKVKVLKEKAPKEKDSK